MLVWWMCLLRFAQTVYWKHVGRKLLKTVQTMTTFWNLLVDPLGTRRRPPWVHGPQFENSWFNVMRSRNLRFALLYLQYFAEQTHPSNVVDVNSERMYKVGHESWSLRSTCGFCRAGARGTMKLVRWWQAMMKHRRRWWWRWCRITVRHSDDTSSQPQTTHTSRHSHILEINDYWLATRKLS